jgi:hypothetical protein
LPIHLSVKSLNRTWTKIVVAAGLIFFFNLTAKSQCDLTCNNLVRVSLGPSGSAIVTPGMLLEDSTRCPGPKTVEILVNGASIGNTVNCSQLNQVLMVRIRHLATGNNCTGSIRVLDHLPPAILCRDTMVPCGTPLSPDSLGFPQFIDNCTARPFTYYSDSIEYFGCFNPQFVAIVHRIWGAIDGSSNIGTCTQRIFLKAGTLADVQLPPNRDNITAPALDCSNPTPLPSVTGYPTIGGQPIQGFCKFAYTYTDQRVDLCNGSFKILREWLIVNCCTNEKITGYQTILFTDTTPPVIVCPDTLRFSADISRCAGTALLPPAVVTDDCSSSIQVRITYPGGSLPTNGGVLNNLPVGTHRVNYIATDGCGNRATCTTVVVIRDDVPPVPVCTKFLVANINSSGIACIPAASFNAGSYDNCCLDSIRVKRMGQPDSLFGQTVCFTCADVGVAAMVVVRFWDCHGNYNDCMTEVKLFDKLAPVIRCPSEVTLHCTADLTDLSLTGNPTARDNCDSLRFVFSDDTTGLNMCRTGTILRKWTVFDGAGFSNSCVQRINLIDLTAPVILFPRDTTVSCLADLDTVNTGEPKFLADCEQFGVSHIDVSFNVRCETIIQRTFHVVEWCSGLDTSYVQTIHIVDDQPPVWDQSPGSLDTTLACAENFFLPRPTATDVCGDSVRVSLASDSLVTGSCPHDFQRIFGFIANDGCGNRSAPFFVKVTVRDTIPPVFFNLPRDTTINCFAGLVEPNLLIVDNCTGFIQRNFTEVSLPGVCPVVEVIRQTWIATDICGNADSIVRLVTVIDTLPPTANAIPDLSVLCPEDIPLPDVNVVTGERDNCNGPVTVSLLDPGRIDNRCLDTLYRVYRLTDNCGNTSQVTQRIIMRDTVPPRLTCPADLTLEGFDAFNASRFCMTYVDSLIATAVDNCPATRVSISNNSRFADAAGADASGKYPLGVHVITFTTTDECLNRETCSMTLTVEDILEPTVFTRSGIRVAINSNKIAVLDSAKVIVPDGTRDFCSPISVSIEPDTFTCANLGVQRITVTVCDTSGNCVIVSNISVLVEDPNGFCPTPPQLPPGTIVGSVRTPNGDFIKNTFVKLASPAGTSTTSTGDGGWYIFEGLAGGENYKIEPSQNDHTANGITTYDLVLITRHILGEERLSSPYAILAADADRSGTISVRDIVELRKIILGKISHFTHGHSWRFIDANYTFANATNPLLEPIPEFREVRHLEGSATAIDFVGMKVGDIDGSASANAQPSAIEIRQLPEYQYFSTPNRQFSAGEVVKVPFFPTGTERTAGFQFTLAFDSEMLEFLELEHGSIAQFSDEHVSLSAKSRGLISVSWNGNAGGEEPLFYLIFEAKKRGQLEGSIGINSSVVGAEWYSEALVKKGLQLRLTSPLQAEVEDQTALYQNEPNPFSGTTIIPFHLAKESPVSLEVFDGGGRQVFAIRDKFRAGRHEIILGRTDLAQSGIYLYRLTTIEGTFSRRMLFIR